MAELVLTEHADGIITVTMNRPEKRNALSPELVDALNATLDNVEKDDDARVLILAGAGKCFCAGMDLRGVLQDTPALGKMLHELSVAMRRIRRLPIPTIAQVHGAAIGGGCGLMVVTDFSVTHPESKVGYPEVSLGVCPAVVAPWLIRRLGPGRARAMLLGGGTVSGREGHELGIATHLAELAAVRDTTVALARQLVTGGPGAIRATKGWLNSLDGSLQDELLDRAAQISAQVIATSEARQRLQAVLSD
jgi:methylglutaconyl-CoA hydratase